MYVVLGLIVKNWRALIKIIRIRKKTLGKGENWVRACRQSLIDNKRKWEVEKESLFPFKTWVIVRKQSEFLNTWSRFTKTS